MLTALLVARDYCIPNHWLWSLGLGCGLVVVMGLHGLLD